jgi:glycerol-3-phosphate dehydrogenase (NAD(P)+)
MDIAVLGAGAFGTSLAKILEGRGHSITLWVRRAEEARRVAETREARYLPGVRLEVGTKVTDDLAQAVSQKPIVLCVTPSHGVRQVMAAAASHLGADAVVVSASKGIEEGTLATIDEIFRQVLPAPLAERAAYLSGPTFAKELVRGLPAAIVVASLVPASATLIQKHFATDTLRIYTSEDVVGVEICGALKNVIAIGAGIADGLGYGHNTRAALITRGLSEIARLGTHLGANPLTFAGLAGMGDLILTCTGDLSRNRQVGLELGRGKTLAEILSGMTAVAEGVKTAKAAHDLAKKTQVNLPIADAIYRVLYEGLSPKDAVVELFKREPKSELG